MNHTERDDGAYRLAPPSGLARQALLYVDAVATREIALVDWRRG